MMLARLAARRTARPAGALLQPRQLLRTTAAAKADDIKLLQELLQKAKEREAAAAAAAAAEAGGEGAGLKFQIQAFNAISPVGLDAFPKKDFLLTGSAGTLPAGVEEEPHAIVLRAHRSQATPDSAAASWPL